jgi:hypothetical protein
MLSIHGSHNHIFKSKTHDFASNLKSLQKRIMAGLGVKAAFNCGIVLSGICFTILRFWVGSCFVSQCTDVG